MASIRLENLVKSFGETVQAVRGVSLEIADGEFVVLVGPSGCGKTTTLHLIAGLERPTSGEVWIGAECVTDWEPGDRNLGMVFQSLALFPHMTVFDNIAFPLMIKKVPPAELGERVRGVATTLHVAHLLDKRPSTLSGGEAQRVALARTIVVKPAAFLMDEPLSSLDAKLRVEMRTELKRLHATLRATFVYVTHDRVRHPRPGRGDDDGAPYRGDGPGPRAADGPAAGHLQRARQLLRGRLLRHPRDELHRRGAPPGLGRLRLPGARTEARPYPLRAERRRAGDAGRAARARSALRRRRGLASRGEPHRALG